MEYSLKFKVNEKIFIKDPESSDLGKSIVSHSIELIHEIGFEAFTFKKLANAIETTEASIYRYFENKHKLLLYILNLYWSYLQYIVVYQLNNMSPKERLISVIKMLTSDIPDVPGEFEFNKHALNQIVIAESSKTYLIKEVNEINKDKVFQPYKELCDKIAKIIVEYNSKYQFPHSLASTLMETAHAQVYFMNHLPRLTDASTIGKKNYTEEFLQDFLFRILDKK